MERPKYKGDNCSWGTYDSCAYFSRQDFDKWLYTTKGIYGSCSKYRQWIRERLTHGRVMLRCNQCKKDYPKDWQEMKPIEKLVENYVKNTD